ncbi:MFS transporter [Anaeromicropila populeti]|uniref:Major Facilitator Superfamily protein n=1 Tax=Anaeromicropila populeti TaxID=37658 RepID=A0A1I6HSE9_9FIRM|nr:MFS transporter [Anaeromicropila populeti]SFR57376.1 Major Facilitator Superfamily protein [Anaeromicropila populeti]
MKKNISGFYLYRFFSRFYFHVPMIFVFFYQFQLSIITIELLIALYGIILMIAPKLILGLKNKYMQKAIIISGELIKALGLGCFILAVYWPSGQFPLLIAGQILSGLGYSFTAGTDSSLLRKVFARYEDTSYDYKQVEAKSNSIMYVAFLTAGVLGSVVFQISKVFMFSLSILSNVLSILSIMLMEEKKEETAEKTSSSSNENEIEVDKKEKQEVNFWKNYYASSRAVTLASFTGFLPYYFFLVVDVNLWYFSAILSLFNLFGFISSRGVLKLSEKIGYKMLTIGTSIILLVALIIFGFSNNLIISILSISLLGLASGGVRPITLSNINKSDISQKSRIKMLSSMEQLYGLYNASLLIAGGIVLQIFNFHYLMIIIIALYAVLIIGSSLIQKIHK